MIFQYKSLLQIVLASVFVLFFSNDVHAGSFVEPSRGNSSASKNLIKRTSNAAATGMTPEQRNLLQQNIKSWMVQHKNEGQIERALAEGDWDFLNEYLSTLSFEVDIDTTTNFNGIDFTVGTVSCSNFAIKDITTEGDGSSTLYDLTFLVEGISLGCVMDYEYDGGFFLRGSGNIDVNVDPATFIQTTLSFNSPNFDTDGPSDASITCGADVQISDLDFNNFLLNLIAPLLIEAIEPEVESLICQPIEALEELLAQSIMDVASILDGLNQPLPPELADPLYPEQMLAPVLEESKLDYIDFAPIINIVDEPLKALVQLLIDQILGEDGVIAVPLLLPIAEGIELVEIRLLGFNDFTLDPFSLIGNYTIQTVYGQTFLGFEIDVVVTLPDGTTEIVEVKTGVNGLALSLSSLLVVEALDDIPWTDPSRALSCLLNTFFAFEVSGLSVSSASLAPIEVAGLSEFQGPADLLNEISEAIFFMYDDLLIKALNFFFETEVRSAINNEVAIRSKTCTEKLVGSTIYIPSQTACYKAQLFDGGVLAVDLSDPGCENEVHQSTEIISVFDYANQNAAYFKEGQFGWSGKMEFRSDFTRSRMYVRATSDPDQKKFLARIILPSCAQSCN